MNAGQKKSAPDKSQKKLASNGAIDDIDKLVALTFDEDPKIRKSVAQDLSNHSDDPRALLALLELSSDKDDEIAKTARKALGTYKETDEEAFTSLEKFYEEARKEDSESAPDIDAAKKRLLPQLEKLFSKNMAKDKLMPSLEKLFSHQASQTPQPGDALSHLEYMHSRKLISSAERAVGIPVSMQSPYAIKEKRHQEQPQNQSKDDSSKQQKLEEAADFPLPENLQQRLHSPVASIPILEGPSGQQASEEEMLPISRLDYYKWAYALAITPGINAKDIKKEKTRLIKEAKKSIELAFKLAVSRAKEEGIESLSALKPGMKRISTFPLEVTDHQIKTVPKSKTKTMEMSRLLLSDGKNSMPLYTLPQRAEGIKTGDLISLKGAYVDYLIKNNTAKSEGGKGELCFKLSKRGQLIITK